MVGVNTFNVDTIAVMGDAIDNRICQRTGITTKLVVSFFEFILGTKNRR